MFASLKEKWNAYVGPKDERLEAETNRYYVRLARVLLIGGCVCLFYDNALRRAAIMFDDGYAASGLSNTVPTGLILALLIVIACLAFVSRITKRGYVDTNRFAATDTFPLGYFTLCSALAALAVTVGTFLIESFAQIQFVGVMGTLWVANIAIGVIFGIIVFVACLIAFWLFYRDAKRNRARIDNELAD